MTTWRKNEPVALRRKCHIQIFWNNPTIGPGGDPIGVVPAWRGTDFMALEIVRIGGANLPDLDPATGTMTNQRIGYVIADKVVEAVDTAADTLKFTAHGQETGDGPVTFAGASLPGGIAAVTNYWLVYSDDDKVQIATSLANAYASPPVVVDITSAGAGAITMSDTPTTQRGVDGRFVYEATQTEVNHDAAEMSIVVDSLTSGDYALKDGAGGSAYVTMDANGALLDTVITDDGKTLGDVLRFDYWVNGAGEIDKDPVTGAIVIWNKTHTKQIATMTLGANGRHVITVNDLGL